MEKNLKARNFRKEYIFQKKISLLDNVFFETIQEIKEYNLELQYSQFSVKKNLSGLDNFSSKNFYLLKMKKPKLYLLNLSELNIEKISIIFTYHQYDNGYFFDSVKPACNPENFNFFYEGRRKRRRFSSEEERRLARILKNRRTAEESRQRRIHKMKYLEELAQISDEKERKLRQELSELGFQNAIQSVESILSI